MPAKKKVVEDEPKLLGRFGSSLKMGIVGMPNVGKSTFFNTLTKSAVPAENFPFCTIDPSESRVAVPDERLDWLADLHKPPSKVPAFLHVVDIAGLVKGASAGQGLGNAFLSHISAVDGILHMLRCFSDDEVTHVEGDVNPVRDLEIIHEELRIKDESALLAWIDKNRKLLERSKEKRDKEDFSITEKIYEYVKAGNDVRTGKWSAREIEVLNMHLLLTAKPVVYLCNCSPKDYIRKKNKWLMKIKEWVDARGSKDVIIPYSAAFEQQLEQMSDEECKAHLEEIKAVSAFPKIITTGFKTLQLQYFFTAGKKEVKAWTIRQKTKAPEAAGKIHTDFERGFIMADVMNFEDLKRCGSEAAVKGEGKYRQQGKEYIMQDGDIVEFKHNVTADKKKK